MPTGICEICGSWKKDLAACPICGQMIGLCCWVFGQSCCLQCKVEHQEGGE